MMRKGTLSVCASQARRGVARALRHPAPLGLALGLCLAGCTPEPRQRFEERIPSEATACFEVVMGLDETPESPCGVANFYVVDPALGCSEQDVPASHECLVPRDAASATSVCLPNRPTLQVDFWCHEMLLGLRSSRPQAGRCTDGWLLLGNRRWFEVDMCVPEVFGRWLHERGFAVSYSDRSPYDGEPVPDPEGCPEVGEALTLCGGDCGPCPNGFDCIGRSPLHPFGLCAIDYHGVSHSSAGAFWFVPPEGPTTALGPEHLYLPLDTCLEAEASLPGGGLCEPH